MAEGGSDVILNIAGNTRQLERDIQKVANSGISLNTKGFSQPLGKITGQLGEFEKSLAASNARVIAFGVSAGAIYAVQKAFSETVKSTIEVEKKLTEINTILSVSQGTLNQFGNSLFDIAKNTGQTFDTVSKSALEFSRQGLGLTETLKRTSDALILTRLSGMDVASSTESITAALNSFNQTALSSSELVNKLVAVDAAFSVSSADLAEAIKRVGSSAQDAGVGLDQLIALVTSAQQITARGGAVIGNSLKTIFTRLQRTETLDALDQLGIKTRDAQGNIMPLIQILTQLSGTFSNLSGTQKSQIAELVGGVYQINILKAALGDLSKEYSIYNQALSTSQGASNEANKRNEEMNKTLSSTFNATLNNLQKVASDIGGVALGPAIKKSLSILNSALENFGTGTSSGEETGSKIGQGVVKGLGNFLGGPGLVIAGAGLIKIFDRLIKYSIDAFTTLTGINAQSSEQMSIQSQILGLIGKNPALIEQINKGNINTVTLHQQILSLIEAETAQMQKQMSVASTLSKSLMLSGVNIPNSGLMKGLMVSGKNKYSGFIPNYSDIDSAREFLGASMGGYQAGAIMRTNIAGEGNVIYNSAEKIKTFPGFNQPAIIPPQNSLAGKIYKENFIKQNKFDPYKSFGFYPNFANQISYEGLGKALRADAVNKLQPILRGKTYFGAERSMLAEKWPQGVPQSMVEKSTETNSFKQDVKSNLTPLEIFSKTPMLTLSGSKRNVGGHKFTGEESIGLPNVNVGFPIFGYRDENKKQQIVNAIEDNIKNEIKNFVKDLKINPPIKPQKINSAMSETEGLLGSIGSQVGGIFEAAFRAAFGETVASFQNTGKKGKSTPTFDVASIPEELTKFFPGSEEYTSNSADFKSSPSEDNQTDMAMKILKAQNRQDLIDKINEASVVRKKRLRKSSNQSKYKGFIPNFSAIKDAIEREKTASGKRPEVLWSNTLGTPVVVNDSQTAKYGKNADRIIRNDHIAQGQYASYSNLMQTGSGKEQYRSGGFIPNFAKIDDYLELSSEEKTAARAVRKISSEEGLNAAFREIERFKEKISSWNLEANTSDQYLKKLTQKFKLTDEEAGKVKEKISSIQNKQDVGSSGFLKGFFSDKNLSESVQKYKTNAIMGSFGISMVGGMASTFFEDNKKVSNSIENFSSAVSSGTALMAVIPGQAGILVGSLSAAAGAFSAISSLIYDKAPDINKKLDSIKEESSNFSNSTQKYSSSLQKFSDAASNPKTSTKDLMKLNQEIFESAREIPSKYRMQLLAIADNVTLQEEINKIQKELIDKQKGLEFASDLQGKLDKNDSWKFGSNDFLNGLLGINNRGGFLEGLGNVVSLGIGPLLDAIQPDFLNQGKKDLSDKFLDYFRTTQLANSFSVEKMSGSIFSGFSKEGKDKFSKDITDLSNVDKIRGFNKDEFVDFLKKSYGLDEAMGEAVRNMAPKDINRLREGIISLGTDAARTAKVYEETDEIRKSTTSSIEKEKRALESAEQSVVSFSTALEDFLKTSISLKFSKQAYEQTNKGNGRDLQLDYIQNLMNYNKGFMSQGSIARNEFSYNQINRQEDFIKSSQDLIRKTKEDLLSTGLDTIISARSGDKGNEQTYRNAQLMLNKINPNESPEQIKQNILNIIKTLPKNQVTAGDREKISEKLNEKTQDGNKSLLELKQKLDQANKIAEQQLKAQMESIRRDVRLNTFGGASSFSDLNPIQSNFENLNKNIENYKTSGNILPLAMQAFNATGGIMPGEEKDFDQVKRFMISERNKQIKTLSLGFADSLSGVGQTDLARVFYKRAGDSGKIATDQVNQAIANMDANEKMGANVANIYGEVRTIAEAMKDLNQNQYNELSPINSIIKDAFLMMNQNFDSITSQLVSKLNEAQSQAEQKKEVYESTKKYENSRLSEAMNRSELKQRMGETPELLAQINTIDKQLAQYVKEKVEKALSEGKAIPTLSEIRTEAKKENLPSDLYSKLDKLIVDSGSETAQAFQRFIQNIRSIQELNTAIQTAIEAQKKAQEEINAKIESMNSRANNAPQMNQGINSPTFANTSYSPTTLGQINTNAQQSQPNNQNKNNSNLNQNYPSQQNQNSNNINQNMNFGQLQNTMSQFSSKISELISSLSNPIQLSPTKINGEIGVNVNPLTIAGNMDLGLKFSNDAGTLKVKVDYGDEVISDIVKQAVEEQISKLEEQIMNDVQSMVETSMSNLESKLNNRPRPSGRSAG